MTNKLPTIDINKELWKDVPSYEGMYQISNCGRVKSLRRNTKNGANKIDLFKKIELGNNGYLRIRLWKNQKVERFLIHRLVAAAFIANSDNKPQVNHKDGNKQNNNVHNLEWATQSENALHAIREKLYTPITKYLKPAKKGRENILARSVSQYTLGNELIRVWDTLTEVELSFNLYHGALSRVLRRKNNKYKGFIWRYQNGR